jgi:hypothetical protein
VQNIHHARDVLNAYNNLVGKIDGKRPLGRNRGREEGNIRIVGTVGLDIYV